MSRIKAGNKVYITTFVKVYEGEVISKDESSNHMSSGQYYIIKIKETGEVLSVSESMLTPTKKDN